MGCGFSTNTTTTSSSSSSSICKNARVVQLNGYVEHFDYPVSVSELTSKLPKHFVCTQSQLLCPCSKPLMPNTYLEPGQIYFLLPFSFFQSGFSPADVATIARKLTNVAKSNRSTGKSSDDANASTATPVSRSPARSPSQFSDLNLGIRKDDLLHQSCRSRSWKPILATIRERSFNRRSESDLQEKNKDSLDRICHSMVAPGK